VLRIIEKKNRIKQVQKQLSNKLTGAADKYDKISIGGKGWNQKARLAYWNKNLDFWWTARDEKDRYWNSFGIGEPRWNTKYSHSITVEINLPKGMNNRLSGVAAVDDRDKIYLMHRGNIGGGRKGIGKSLFIDNFTGEWEEVWEKKKMSTVALVASLDSQRFLKQLSTFVHEVARIKDERIEKLKPKVIKPDIFREEFHGKKEFRVPNDVEVKCDHDLIIGSLEKKLKSHGLRVGNRLRMDLYVLNKDDKIVTLYEAKTDDSLNSCCQAIGQLLYYSRRLRWKSRLVAVLPDTLNKETRRVFQDLGIDLLTYNWVKNEPHFESPIL